METTKSSLILWHSNWKSATPLATSLRSYLLPWVTYGRLAEAHVHMVMEFDFDEQDMRMCRLRMQSRIRSFTYFSTVVVRPSHYWFCEASTEKQTDEIDARRVLFHFCKS